MSERHSWTHHDSLNKGPFPLMATINGELDFSAKPARYEQLLRQKQLSMRAFMPIALELSVPRLEGSDIPLQFAKAHDAAYGPIADEYRALTEDAHPRGRREGAVCILPEPLEIGVSALILWNDTRYADLSWDLGDLLLLAEDPSVMQNKMNPYTQRIPELGRVVRKIPRLTTNDVAQRMLEKDTARRLDEAPNTLDILKELAPGIWKISVKDGIGLEESDLMTCHDFVQTAQEVFKNNPGNGKTVYTALVQRAAETQAWQMRARRNFEQADELLNKVEAARHMLQLIPAWSLSDTDPKSQIALEYETARDIALAVIDGSIKLTGVGKQGITLLQHLFDKP